MAVTVAVAVSGGVAVPVAVPVAGLTKRFFSSKRFLNQCLGLMRYGQVAITPMKAICNSRRLGQKNWRQGQKMK